MRGGGGVAGSQPMSTAVHRSPNKLWRFNSILDLRLLPPHSPLFSLTLPLIKRSLVIFTFMLKRENLPALNNNVFPILQCCGSRMFIPDPEFYPSRISDLGSRIQKQQRKKGVKKISCHTFFCSHKFHKIENYFIFETLKKKICANFKEIQNFSPKKLGLSSQK